MVRVLAFLGLLANAGVIVLLLGLSYYVFGGPEGPLSDPPGLVVWSSAVAICLGAVIGAWRLGRSGRPKTGLAILWLPAAVAFVLVVIY